MVPPLLSPACTAEVEKVVRLSQEEHLQPFKDNMEAFLSQGRAAEHPLTLTPLPVFISLLFLCSSHSSSSVHLTPLPLFSSLLFLCSSHSSSSVFLSPLPVFSSLLFLCSSHSSCSVFTTCGPHPLTPHPLCSPSCSRGFEFHWYYSFHWLTESGPAPWSHQWVTYWSGVQSSTTHNMCIIYHWLVNKESFRVC